MPKTELPAMQPVQNYNESCQCRGKHVLEYVCLATNTGCRPAAAIYIAIYVLKNVGSFTKQNAADFLTGDKKGLLLLMFKTTVIISLLKDTWLIDNIISPVMQAGLNIGAKLSVTGATMATSSGSGYDAIFKMVNESVKQFNDQVYETIAIGNA